MKPMPIPSCSRPLRRLGAVLLVVLAGATSTVVGAQPMMGHGGVDGPECCGYHGGPAGGRGAGAAMLPARLLDAVGASAEQKTRVRDIFEAAQADLATQRESGRALHQQMLQLLAAPQIDAAAAESLRRQQQAQREVASKRMLQAMLDASAVLTPDQRQKLAEQMKVRRDMMERHQRERQQLQAPRS